MITDNKFGPTPGLKSSPIPILFIPFKDNESKCNYCGINYSKTLQLEQKYCKNCLFWYIQYTKNSTGNNTYLDVHICTDNIECIEHKESRNSFNTTNIQEWCEYCSAILYFKQVIPSRYYIHYFNEIDYEKLSFKFDLDCYQISSRWVESTLNKKPILILYLPWWDNYEKCIACSSNLKYICQETESYSKKWCSCCFIIYTGCRYCLTTNMIFGITDQSQCKNCKRMLFINIDITNIISGDCIIDEFLASTRIDSNSQHLIANYINNDPNSSLLNLYAFIINLFTKKQVIEWIPFSQVKNLEKIAEGGFSIIYKAIWSDGICDLDVAVKKLSNSQNISKYVLNELKSLYYCGDIGICVIKCYGISKNPLTKEYMLIMDYAKGGNLYNYLQKHFTNITWTEKIKILTGISYGLQAVHRNNFIHRDIHSGNILLSQHWQIGDLGLSQPADNTLSNNEIYGVIPYIAPEIFKGAAFSKESDIYSFGIVMWELTTGCKPFINVEHNANLIYEIIDGKRPEITRDTPECYANLMKKCWDSDPLKRSTIDEVWDSAIKWCQLVDEWIYSGISLNDPVDSADLDETIKQAEKKRLELIRSEKLGPKYTEKSHPKAVFTSRALSSFISSSRISFNLKQEYITKEYEFDINDIQSSSTQNIINSDAQNSFNSQHQNVYISRPLRPLSKLITTVIANTSSKRNIKELNIEAPNNRKHIKPNNSD